MPLYEYQCETCHHQFEVQQKFSDPLVDTCIRCGKGVRKTHLGSRHHVQRQRLVRDGLLK